MAPQWYPKSLFSKSARSKLFNAVPTIPLAILNPNLHPMEKVRFQDEFLCKLRIKCSDALKNSDFYNISILDQ
eukprot:UN24270